MAARHRPTDPRNSAIPLFSVAPCGLRSAHRVRLSRGLILDDARDAVFLSLLTAFQLRLGGGNRSRIHEAVAAALDPRTAHRASGDSLPPLPFLPSPPAIAWRSPRVRAVSAQQPSFGGTIGFQQERPSLRSGAGRAVNEHHWSFLFFKSLFRFDSGSRWAQALMARLDLTRGCRPWCVLLPASLSRRRHLFKDRGVLSSRGLRHRVDSSSMTRIFAPSAAIAPS